MTELIVGTAQFGAAYGITNAAGRLDDREVSAILGVAAEGGVTMFDTAPDYGDAQERLGRLNVHPGARYVSKFSLPPEGDVPPNRIYGDTLATLGVGSLHGLLFHKPADLRDPRAATIWRQMREARDAGTITRIGASIYDADDLAVVTTTFPGLDLIQLPGSIVDRRLLDSREVRALHDGGVEIHVRSAYLQGLLLLDPAELPGHVSALREPVVALRAAASAAGTSVAAILLAYLARHPVVDSVLVGATSASELDETLVAWSSAAGVDHPFPDPALPVAVVDPRRWPPRSAS